jgi:uncharacterized membrane protein YbhN (UPF0104 family)
MSALPGIGRSLRRAKHAAGRAFLWAEDKPMVVIFVSAGATAGVSVLLASYAGWPHVLHLIYTRHSWLWLVVCMAGELIAYGGYMLTVRDMARIDGGQKMDIKLSAEAVVGGFGVFAATRASGGFAVDYWAFRRTGAARREALTRVLGLGFLEYATLSLAALVASALLYFDLDGGAGDGVTLPSLIVIPVFALALWATSPRRVSRLSQPRRGLIKRTLADSVAGASYVRDMFASPREHGTGVLGNTAYWAGDILCLWAALQIVRSQLSVAALVLAYSGGYVLTRRALPAGGAGLVEVALTFALVGMGLQFVPALVGVIIYRLFNFWLPIVPALILLPALRDLRARFREAERETPRLDN